MVARAQLRRPAGLDHDRRGRLDDDRGSRDPIARAQMGALEHRRRERLGRLVRRPRGDHRDPIYRLERLARAARHDRQLRLVDLRHAADRLDRHLHDHETAAFDHEPVTGAVLGLEGPAQLGGVGRGQLERGIGAAVADVHAGDGRDARRLHALALEFPARRRREFLDRLLERLHQGIVEGRLDRPLPDHAHVCQAHAVGRQHARERMHENAREPQRIGDQAGVLPGRAAEAAEHVIGDVVAALDRDLLDRIGHVVDRDREATMRQLFGRALDAGGARHVGRQCAEGAAHHPLVQRLLGVGPEHVRKEARMQLADHQIGVGDRERPAAPIAGRTGTGPGELRPDPEARAIEGQDRATARGDRVDRHHRRAQPHARHLGLEGALVRARAVGDIGRRPAHVERDDALKPGEPGDPHGTDDTACRSGQDGVLALEAPGVDQPAVRLHEHQPDVAERCGDPVDVAPQNRRQIGVDHGGVAAADQLHQGRDLVADRDLGEAERARQLGERQLMRVVAIAVHQHDRQRAPAARQTRREIGLGLGQVDRPLDRAVGAHALLDLDHVGVQHLGQHDVPGEDVGAVLVADAQRVAEAGGDREHGRLPAPLEQSVGGHRRAHLDRVDRARGDRLVRREAQQLADALERRVFVLLGVVGQEFVYPNRALGVARDDVGERAAPVDPELPVRTRARAWSSPLLRNAAPARSAATLAEPDASCMEDGRTALPISRGRLDQPRTARRKQSRFRSGAQGKPQSCGSIG